MSSIAEKTLPGGSLIERIARGRISVLVLGETGVGKEVVTRQIHQASSRANKPFLRINCAAFTESLIASELFGHERGAFTGADAARRGLLECADGGTVFLDEVGELPLGIQAKFLRVLEQQEIIRVGGTDTRRIDVRVIAATNRDLEEDVEGGRFRRDLFFRIAAAIVRVPPLRERRSEIAAFARGFLAEASAADQVLPTLSATAVQWLERQPWPGNLRELRNTIERAVLLCDGPVIDVEHLNPRLQLSDTREGAVHAPRDERQRVMMSLIRHGGNQTRAARELRMARNTLIARIEQYGLARPRKSESD